MLHQYSLSGERRENSEKTCRWRRRGGCDGVTGNPPVSPDATLLCHGDARERIVPSVGSRPPSTSIRRRTSSSSRLGGTDATSRYQLSRKATLSSSAYLCPPPRASIRDSVFQFPSFPTSRMHERSPVPPNEPKFRVVSLAGSVSVCRCTLLGASFLVLD